MIDEKKIVQAANNYANSGKEFSYSNKVAFLAGINWYRNNILHSNTEQPERGKTILFEALDFKGGTIYEIGSFVNGWKTNSIILGIGRWLYIDDLLKGGK